MISFAEEALPRILGSRALTTKVIEELKRHHRWLGIFFLYSKRLPRMLRVLSLTTNIIVMLFVQSITYNLSHGDDGSCETWKTSDQCLAESSAYTTTASKCVWSEEERTCSFVQPDNDVKVVIFVAIFSALVSTPLAMVMGWIIQTVLAAPTLEPNTTNGVSGRSRMKLTPSRNAALISVIPDGSIVGHKPELKSSMKSLSHIQSNVQAELEFAKMLDELRNYRQYHLQEGNQEQFKEFDGKENLLSCVFCLLLARHVLFFVFFFLFFL
jgi:hypothetical protein